MLELKVPQVERNISNNFTAQHHELSSMMNRMNNLEKRIRDFDS